LIALDDALERLAASYPRAARVIELRFFGGSTVDETARALATSPRTIDGEWSFARAWLARELRRA
jgi:DNA-directed RNA polymerase specialized sigma24 family protein